MFEEPTVLIVGAGGSADFGAPTGKTILDALLSEPLNRTIDAYNIGTDLFQTDFLNFLRFNGFDREKQAMQALLDKARSSVAPSIDLFAYHNAEILDVSKLYSTWKILGGLYEVKHDFRKNTPPHVRPTNKWREPRRDKSTTWLAHLTRKYLENCDSAADLNKNNLSVITFNYDTILEDALRHLIRSNQRYADADKNAFPTVHHVFGKFPDLQSGISPSEIHEASRAIRYMYELDGLASEDGQLPTLQQAMKKAAYVYIVGFDLNKRNVELIGLKESQANKFALNFDGNPGLHSRLINAGVKAEHIMSGNHKAPLYASTACDQGFFELADYYPKTKHTITFV